MLAATQRELAAAGVAEPPGVLLADAGYRHGEQMQRIADNGIAVLIPPDANRRQSTRRTWNGGPTTTCAKSSPPIMAASLPPAPSDHRARCSQDEVQPRHRPLPTTRPSRRPHGMATDHRHPQPPQAPPAHSRGRLTAAARNRPPRRPKSSPLVSRRPTPAELTRQPPWKAIAACLAAVERFEERADGRRVVLLWVALQVRDEGATPPPVHQLDGDQAVHGRPDEVRVGRRVGEIGSPIGDAGGKHLEGRESCQAAGVRRDEVRGRPLEHESVERVVVECERAVGQGERQQLLPALTIGGDAVEPFLQASEAVQVELLQQPLL